MAGRAFTAATQDALGRMFGEDGEKQVAPGHPHVILALANHGAHRLLAPCQGLAARDLRNGGSEEALQVSGGQAATLLLEHLKQEPMPIVAERDRMWAQSGSKK